MNTPNGAEQPYHVSYLGPAKERLKVLAIQAGGSGQKDQFLASLNLIDQHLARRPHEFGEPLYSLPAAKLDIRLGALRPLSVVYGVHREKKIVFVRDFELMG